MARTARTTIRALTKARTAATTRSAVNYPKELSTTSYNGTTNLKAYYRFNNGGELLDETANNSDLTAIGVPVQATPRWGTGCVGLGTSQAFSAVDGADFQPAGNFSVSAWFRTNKTGATQVLFQTYSQNTNVAGIQLTLSAANKAQGLSGKNSGTTENTDWKRILGNSTTLCNGNWHHVVMTYDGTHLKLYVDGAEDTTEVDWTDGAVFSATNYVRIGVGNSAGSNASYFQGILDEVAFFPSDALSLAQVKSLYAKSITDTSNSAIKALASAVYLFNEGGQLVDSSTGGTHTLTAIGKPTTCTPKFGGSVFLGNSSAYSAVDADILKPTGAFSVGGWVKTTTTGIEENIIQSFSSNTNLAGWRLRINTGNTIVFNSGKNTGTVTGTDWQAITGNGVISVTDGNWHFVVGVWDGSYLRIYIDGIEAATPVAWANAPAYAATNYVRVGCRNTAGTNSTFILGQLDDIFLLNGTALTADEVNYIYTQRLKIT
jgi:hypothetical protein